MLTTSVIWIATAFIFIFGVFHTSVTGNAIFFWFLISITLAAGPTVATVVIWSKPDGKPRPPDNRLS